MFNEKNIEEDQIDFDVVVIGAGLSGLTAANRLVAAGLSVKILEKENFAGGRLLSKECSESFYAHELQSRLNEMIMRLKLTKVAKAIENDSKVIHIRKNEILNESLPSYVPVEVHLFIKTMNSMSKKISQNYYASQKMNEKLSNVSVEDVLCQLVFFEKSRAICRNLIFATCGIVNLKEMSALWYLNMLNGASGFIQRLRVNLGDPDRFFVKDGLMSVAQLLIENIEKTNPIQYNEGVYKIQFNDDRAHIWTSRNAHYKCQYVIVAVPPFESSEIAVEPRLPEGVRQAQSSFQQGKNVFFNGICRHSQERDNSVKCVIDAENTSSILRLAYDASYDERFRISGYLSGTTADDTERIGIISTLNKCFGTSISDFDEYTESGWRNIPTGMPMNVLRPGSLRSHVHLLSYTHGRSQKLFFNIDKPNVGIILAHNICFWFNLYISLSYLRNAILSLQPYY